MAHMLETKADGVLSMFSARNISPWHRGGVIVDKVETTAEAIVLAGMDWRVKLASCFTAEGKLIEGHKVVQRETDGNILGMVGDRYNPLQNVEAFSFFDAFLKSGECNLETAGSLFGGSKVWILARINRDPLMIGGVDKVDKYLLLSNSHDGKNSAKVGLTLCRPVCANTLALAHGDKASRLMRVRHSARIVPALEEIKLMIDTVDAEFKATAEVYERMADKGINRKDLEAYVCKVFDASPDDPPRAMTQILENFDHGAGSDVAGQTVYGAYQACTEFLSNQQGRTDEGRLNANAWGTSVAVNQAALNYAYNFVQTGAF